MKFCCNPLCRFHIEAEPGQNRMRWIDTVREFEGMSATLEVRQLLIRDVATQREFRFCEVCANAVALVNEQPK